MSSLDPRPIHHVTTLATDARATHAFYVGALGMRLVKRTVNFDDPGTYHLYVGDELGRPGTLLTFFPYAGLPAGRIGAGQAAATALAIPSASLEFWSGRLAEHGVDHTYGERFGQRFVALADPDGLALELVAAPYAADLPGWGGGPVDASHAIRGVDSVTLWETADHGTAALLGEVLHFTDAGTEGDLHRWTAGEGIGATVLLRRASGLVTGRGGAGTVHHVAFRAADGDQQRDLRLALARRGVAATEIIDRQYFESIYFREPGGVLFEIATDAPGMAIDEPVEALGESLKLPPQYESHRAQVEATLPPLPRVIAR